VGILTEEKTILLSEEKTVILTEEKTVILSEEKKSGLFFRSCCNTSDFFCID
jgi:hypothetical protein